jgi:hypothetical protein
MTLLKVKDKWYVQVMSKGNIYTAGQGFAKKEDGLEAQTLLKSKLRKPAFKAKHVIFYTLWVEYLNYLKETHSKGYYDSTRYTGNKYFKKWFEKSILYLNSSELLAHLVERRKLSSAQSANREFDILRTFFNWCTQMGYLDENPILGLAKFPISSKVMRGPEQPDIVGRKLTRSTISKEIVQYLQESDPIIINKNFKENVLKALGEVANGLKNDFPKVVPDAHKICENCQSIFIYEIDYQNPLTKEKLESYAQFWFDLDSYNWQLFLYLIDKYDIMLFEKSKGSILNKRLINLSDYFYAARMK